MLIYLAGTPAVKHIIFDDVDFKFNRMESFYYARKDDRLRSWIKRYNRIMVDSGAFTFIMGKQDKKIDINKFTAEYIDFVNEYNIDLFFEMDVDKVYGYSTVKKLRKKIEQGTGKQTIPVYHMSRGKADWRAMCKDYPYIALGIGGKDFSFTDVNAFKAFNGYAQEQGCKVHMLGVTGMTVLDKVPFTSVDSSSWLSSNRYGGSIHRFNGHKIQIIGVKDKVIKDQTNLMRHNLTQWIKYSNYKEHNGGTYV